MAFLVSVIKASPSRSDSFVEYLGPRLLVEYGIGAIDLHVNNHSLFSVSKVRVELVRRYGYAMLNIYIPSLTLLIISYVTLFFRPSIFEVTLGVVAAVECGVECFH